jgi:hypothetical protein
MSERNAAVGYVAIKKETVKGTAVTPTVYVPYYKQSMTTDFNVISDEPVVGNKFKRYQTLKGLRSHKGSITIMAEANSLGYFMDMLATKASTAGSDPYTHTFSASNTTDPHSYTMDISLGSQVIRFTGVEASKVVFGFSKEKMTATFDLSALGSFYGREITSVSTTTINFTTDGYDPSPTTGLVASDLISVVKIDGSSSLNTSISSITDSDTIVAGATAAAYSSGDMVVLRAATPSYNLLQPFLWPRTLFYFGATASAALSATQIRLDSGSEITIMHEFDDDEGAKRSGSFDPASLVRTVYDAEFKLKKFFDTADEIKYWNAQSKRSCVMRAYTGSTNQYELRVTLNNILTKQDEIPTESAGVIYHEIKYSPNYDTSDSQGFDVKVLNAVSTI